LEAFAEYPSPGLLKRFNGDDQTNPFDQVTLLGLESRNYRNLPTIALAWPQAGFCIDGWRLLRSGLQGPTRGRVFDPESLLCLEGECHLSA